MQNYLYVAIVYSKYAKGFSDASMIRYLKKDFSSNTIRNIRKRLQNENLIAPIKLEKKFPKNEKFYKIKNLKKAMKVKDYYWEIWFNKENKKERGKFYVKYNKRIPEELTISYETIPNSQFNKPEKFSRKLYLKKICPICKMKMKEFMSSKNYGQLDRKCFNCGYKFRYLDGFLRAVKE